MDEKTITLTTTTRKPTTRKPTTKTTMNIHKMNGIITVACVPLTAKLCYIAQEKKNPTITRAPVTHNLDDNGSGGTSKNAVFGTFRKLYTRENKATEAITLDL